MNRIASRLIVVAVSLAAGLIPAGKSQAQSEITGGFLYSGSLRLHGEPINSPADFRFRLFDSETGGNQVGATLLTHNRLVRDGNFTYAMNFGAGVFNGDVRWLEVRVRHPAASGNWVTLTPRQRLHAVPYALYAVR